MAGHGRDNWEAETMLFSYSPMQVFSLLRVMPMSAVLDKGLTCPAGS
jgi:hypothetical protein